MKKYILGAMVFLASMSGPALAGDQSSRAFSSETGRIVVQTQTIMQSGDYPSAVSGFENILKADLNAFERSTVEQMRAAGLYELGRLDDALDAFDNAVEAGGLTPQEASTVRLNMAQLYLVQNKRSEALAILQALESEGYALTDDQKALFETLQKML